MDLWLFYERVTVMVSRCKPAGWPLFTAAALAMSLTLAAVSQAGKKPKPAPQKAPANPAAATLQFEEAQALREAFIMLAGGNHDYAGHRVKAMASLKHALGILDGHIMTHGTKAQKAATKKEQAVAAAAEAAGNRTPGLHTHSAVHVHTRVYSNGATTVDATESHTASVPHKPQRLSDVQLGRAGELLVKVRATLVAKKQKRVLAHVDSAIREIGIALKIQ